MKAAIAILAGLMLLGCGDGETPQSRAEDAAVDAMEPYMTKVGELENRVDELEARVARMEAPGAI